MWAENITGIFIYAIIFELFCLNRCEDPDPAALTQGLSALHESEGPVQLPRQGRQGGAGGGGTGHVTEPHEAVPSRGRGGPVIQKTLRTRFGEQRALLTNNNEQTKVRVEKKSTYFWESSPQCGRSDTTAI